MNQHFKNGTYYHQTSGGAEYLSTTFVECPNREKEGTFEGVYARIDGAEFELFTGNLKRFGFKTIRIDDKVIEL